VALGVLGIMGSILAITGVFGLAACSVSRRLREIGIRMALGARRAQVVGMVYRQNASVALAGTAGLIAALLASRTLASFLYGISARDPWVFAGSILTLALIASAASLLPALRSARINPMIKIRCE
jgi:putative ABC transport system permease protein